MVFLVRDALYFLLRELKSISLISFVNELIEIVLKLLSEDRGFSDFITQ
jgi:fumarate reductase subunit C